MNKKLIIGFSIFILIVTNITEVSAEEIAVTKEQIIELGIPKEYSENIVTYIDNMNLSNEEIVALINKNQHIVDYLKEDNKITKLELKDILTLHNYIDETLQDLKLELDLDIFDRKIRIIDSIKENILFQCEIGEIEQYYEDFIEAGGAEHVKLVFLNINLEELIKADSTNSYEEEAEDYIEEKKLKDNYESNVVIENIELEELTANNTSEGNIESENRVGSSLKYLGVLAIIIILLALLKL